MYPFPPGSRFSVTHRFVCEFIVTRENHGELEKPQLLETVRNFIIKWTFEEVDPNIWRVDFFKRIREIFCFLSVNEVRGIEHSLARFLLCSSLIRRLIGALK